MLTCAPYFTLFSKKNNSVAKIENPFHPESAAGIFWQNTKKIQPLDLSFENESRLGGLGASSAEFVSLALLSGLNNPWQIWDEYRKISSEQKGTKPSGADVLVQSFQSGEAITFLDFEKQILETVPTPFSEKFTLSILHTGVKLATHEHLKIFEQELPVEKLNKITEASRKSKNENFGELLNEYHSTLSSVGLVAEHSLKHIENLAKISGIIGVKGSGAMGADLIIVFYKTSEIEKIQKTFQEYNLKEIHSIQGSFHE